jgi:mRNA interferase HigB
MRVFSRSTLREYSERNPDAEQALDAWYRDARRATWKSPSDIRNQDPTASIIAKDRVVFDIRGNRYRLVVHVRYGEGLVFVRFIGTHQEYDRIDATTI